MKYTNRTQAGDYLASFLTEHRQKKEVLVLALPRGGVPVAYEIAAKLQVSLDVLIVRKLGVPSHAELAMGAISSEGTVIFNEEIIQSLHISAEAVDQVLQKEQEELKRRESRYRDNRPVPDIKNKTIILVDDGIATGATMKTAIAALRLKQPKNIIIAVPVAARETCEELANLVEAIICPLQPDHFYAVGAWYEQFTQTTDEEVIDLLKRHAEQL